MCCATWTIFPTPSATTPSPRCAPCTSSSTSPTSSAPWRSFIALSVPGGRIFLVTPHYTDFSSFCDPTHRWHLNSFSFRYFGPDHGGFGYYSPARFREVSVRVRLLAFWRWLGFEFLVNHFPRFRRFWEHYLCYVVRGKVMEFEFEAIK